MRIASGTFSVSHCPVGQVIFASPIRQDLRGEWQIANALFDPNTARNHLAAATSDPTYGQGLSFALRAARVLRDELTSHSNWDAAGHRYADEHQRRFRACHEVEGWFRTIFQDPSPEAAAVRAKAMPGIIEDPTRVPDRIMSGPELPWDENVRARFFGEC